MITGENDFKRIDTSPEEKMSDLVEKYKKRVGGYDDPKKSYLYLRHSDDDDEDPFYIDRQDVDSKVGDHIDFDEKNQAAIHVGTDTQFLGKIIEQGAKNVLVPIAQKKIEEKLVGVLKDQINGQPSTPATVQTSIPLYTHSFRPPVPLIASVQRMGISGASPSSNPTNNGE